MGEIHRYSNPNGIHESMLTPDPHGIFVTYEAELAALRAKWEALRGECEAWRAADEECGFIVRNNRVMDSRTLTDSTHALENP